MKDLDSFSIESDQIVLLTYRDGTNRRALRADLPQLLAKADLKRVHAAYRLRHNYRDTLPPWLRALALTVIVLSAGLGSMKVVSTVIHPATHTIRHIADTAGTSGEVLDANANQPSGDSATASNSALAAPSVPQPAVNQPAMPNLSTPAPSPIKLPLGVTVPAPTALVPTVVQAVTQPVAHTVTHALNSLGL